MVQTEQGFELAKITMIDFEFNIIIDEYVKPKNPIINY